MLNRSLTSQNKISRRSDWQPNTHTSAGSANSWSPRQPVNTADDNMASRLALPQGQCFGKPQSSLGILHLITDSVKLLRRLYTQVSNVGGLCLLVFRVRQALVSFSILSFGVGVIRVSQLSKYLS